MWSFPYDPVAAAIAALIPVSAVLPPLVYLILEILPVVRTPSEAAAPTVERSGCRVMVHQPY
jgi:hypothetical protein